MWMRMIRSHGLTSAKMKQAVEEYRNEDLAVVEEAPGFLGIALGHNDRGGSIGSVTFWESAQAMADTDRASAQARERALPLYDAPNPMMVDHFEIADTAYVEPFAGEPKQPHLRLVRFTGMTVGAIDQAIDSYRESIREHLSDTRGAYRVVLGGNYEVGSFTVVTFWTSAREMREANHVSSGARERAGSASGLELTQLVDTFQITISSGLERLTAANASVSSA